jgi:hypothetical protein
MKIQQRKWMVSTGWDSPLGGNSTQSYQLVFIMGSTALLKEKKLLDEIRCAYPKAYLFGCSTAGEICGIQVSDDSLVLTAVHFEHTLLQSASAVIERPEDSFQIGEKLAKCLRPEGLSHVLVLSDGLSVNGSDLVKGLMENLPKKVAVTGGLSGDGARFQQTWVVAGGEAKQNTVAIVGLYGEKLKVGYGSLGGWDSFGPERVITRSSGNVLYDLDRQPALELYKKYLGEHAAGLPSTGLLFPLSLKISADDTAVVRTILAVNEKDRSMTFAGNVPEGATTRLMKANFDRLIDGASGAAKNSMSLQNSSPDLALLISCVGRKLVLGQRIEEEVEGVRDVLGAGTVLMGFYSYGEISPFTPGAKCELHNQTMTITTLSER